LSRTTPPPKSVSRAPKPPEWLESFIEVQREEVRVRAGELEIRKLQAENGHDYALKALDAMSADRKEERQSRGSQRVWRYVFAGIVLITSAGLLVFLVDRGKDELAEELVKLVAYVAVGGLGG
jgi:hypothetical protein